MTDGYLTFHRFEHNPTIYQSIKVRCQNSTANTARRQRPSSSLGWLILGHLRRKEFLLWRAWAAPCWECVSKECISNLPARLLGFSFRLQNFTQICRFHICCYRSKATWNIAFRVETLPRMCVSGILERPIPVCLIQHICCRLNQQMLTSPVNTNRKVLWKYEFPNNNPINVQYILQSTPASVNLMYVSSIDISIPSRFPHVDIMIWKEYGAESRQAVAAADYADEEAHASLVLGRGPCPVIVTFLPFNTTIVYVYFAKNILVQNQKQLEIKLIL